MRIQKVSYPKVTTRIKVVILTKILFECLDKNHKPHEKKCSKFVCLFVCFFLGGGCSHRILTSAWSLSFYDWVTVLTTSCRECEKYFERPLEASMFAYNANVACNLGHRSYARVVTVSLSLASHYTR